jgi:hypothetical protein
MRAWDKAAKDGIAGNFGIKLLDGLKVEGFCSGPKGSNFVEQDHPSELFRVEPGFNVSISMGSL